MKSCLICKKTSGVVGGYSNSVRATKYNPTVKSRQQPNLQWATFPDGHREKICTKCIKAGKHLK
jgi:ribosomal protein L28